LSRKAIGNAGVHGSNVIHRQVGVNLPDGCLQRQPKRLRRQAGADNHEDVTVVKGVGIIDRALRCFLSQSRLLHASNNANNRKGIGIFACLAAVE